jgi:hypothetical protein
LGLIRAGTEASPAVGEVLTGAGYVSFLGGATAGWRLGGEIETRLGALWVAGAVGRISGGEHTSWAQFLGLDLQLGFRRALLPPLHSRDFPAPLALYVRFLSRVTSLGSLPEPWSFSVTAGLLVQFGGI